MTPMSVQDVVDKMCWWEIQYRGQNLLSDQEIKFYHQFCDVTNIMLFTYKVYEILICYLVRVSSIYVETVLYFPIDHGIHSWLSGRCLLFPTLGKQHSRSAPHHWSIWTAFSSFGILSLILTDALHLFHRWRNICHRYTPHLERFLASLAFCHIDAIEFLLAILVAQFYSKTALWFSTLTTAELQPASLDWSGL